MKSQFSNRNIRLQNCSFHKLPFFYKYARETPFSLKLLSNTDYLAPGMYVDFELLYCAKIYHNYSIDIEFSTYGGYKTILKAMSFRKPPHLRVYIFRSMKHIFHTKCPGNLEFWERRCTALNDTIDCGHCFIGSYNYLSLIIGNIGSRGHFFFLTEDEWISGNVSNVDHAMQFSKDSFKIFPSYISVDQDEVAEICVTFTPTGSGLHIEKLYLISDNNTAKAVEIIGDGLYFKKNMIQTTFRSSQFEDMTKLVMGDENEWPSNHKIYMGYITNLTSNKITFTVNNQSAIYLNFYWIFRNTESYPHSLNPDHVHIENINHDYLAPYTTYDFDVDVVPEVEENGHYGIILNLCVEKIPEQALAEGEEFIVRNRTECENIKFLDVQVYEVELGCEIILDEREDEIPKEDKPKKCDCEKPTIPLDEKLTFSSPLLDLGLLPIGVDLEKSFDIINLTEDVVEWRLVEIIYDVDLKPSMMVAQKPATDICSGTLTGKRYRLKYYIKSQRPRRWVSMLLLFTGTNIQEMKLNSVCTVTYQILNWDIRIFSKVSKYPIVCSLKLHYIGLKYKWNFFLKNYTPILGCFWLFPPIGEEAEMLELNFHPKFGVIRPGEKINVEVTVNPKEVGIIEKIFIPCFISKHCAPIMIRFLCAVDDVNVYFYIPSQAEGYDKILWPPKVLSEVDFQQMKSTEVLWTGEEENYTYPFDCKNDEKLTSEGMDADVVTPDITNEISCTQSCKDVDYTLLTHKSSGSYIISLTEFLKEQFKSEFIKQDYIVQIRDVSLKKPQKFSFYIENVTPINAEFTIETTNFEPCIDGTSNWSTALTLLYPQTASKTWDEACRRHGIVVIPDIEKGLLECGEVVQINIWIYATTWGIYAEEVVVNINNITPFYFNVFIEVNGAPVEFPMAVNTIRNYPTLRFGHIPYMADPVTQFLQFKNTSCIPINIQWFLFDALTKAEEVQPFNVILDLKSSNFRTPDELMNVFLSNKSYGEQDVHFMQIHPRSADLAPGALSDIEIRIDPNYFPVNFEETNIFCNLIGYIFIKEQDKIQQNLVFRKAGSELKPLHVEILATIAMPLLKLDMLCGISKIKMNATEIMEGTAKDELIKLTLKNNNLTTVFVTFHVDSPFYIVDISMRDYEYVQNVNNAVIRPGDIVEIQLKFMTEPEEIIRMANNLYISQQPKNLKKLEENKNKMINLHRHLNIHQRGVLEQSIPVFCEIYFPRIEVRPTFLKFDYVNIGLTKKLFLHLYNASKVDIEFEIRKSTPSTEFTVKPIEGVIPKAIGLTRSIVDISIYFSPKLYFYYQESIIIQTKIPQCWLEVPMNGYGIQNEKFDIDNIFFSHELNKSMFSK
ncbi:hypothetical protein HHI36_007102 [Cryptolaemus montrouzieri]|uniref:Uncharacterized protein n=1 Tax=Cryptolaemus montrouzieri TaxID=559131 RepID=A0ABD2MNX0_9CUCU